MADLTSTITRCSPLLRFQVKIARNWYSRAERSDDLFAKFFFYFSGFNALYFAWAKADDLRNSQGKEAGDLLQIKNLLRKLNSEEAEEILVRLGPEIEFFSRREPIQRMDKRTCRSFDKGEEREGRRAREELESLSPVDRLVALGKILYFVRCNLVHGSKAVQGDDERVIKTSMAPLKLILERAIEYTEKQLSEPI